MNISFYLQLSLFWILLIGISAVSCTTDQNQVEESVVTPGAERKVEAQDSPTPQFEEVLPDSGMMKNINPEEIITDDWTSDSPDAEADQN